MMKEKDNSTVTKNIVYLVKETYPVSLGTFSEVNKIDDKKFMARDCSIVSDSLIGVDEGNKRKK